jgi:N-acetylmuramoyl-L-alanine amidase
MARLPARGVLVVLALWATVTVFAQQTVVAAKSDSPSPLVPVRAAPTRPSKLWSFIRLRGADYVSLREVAGHYGLKLSWTKPAVVQTMSDARGVRLNFESNQRDFFFDGARIFLGAPVLFEKDTLWVSKLDLIKIVAPLIRPSDHAAYLPAATPKLIVIDAGHGGIDPGTENKKLGVNEKTFTLDVALRLKKLLEFQGWRVLLTRSDDRELSKSKIADLQMRVDLANKQNADLFLSIHFNAADEPVSGVEVYSLAAQFMLSSGSEKKDDLTNQVFPNNRFDYANLLLGDELHRSMLATLKSPDRGYKRARFAVLRPVDCPAALVECAYLSNTAEARRVSTPEFRQKIAEGLASGLQNYSAAIATLRPPSPVVAAGK